jgi:hypothetical protein
MARAGEGLKGKAKGVREVREGERRKGYKRIEKEVQ